MLRDDVERFKGVVRSLDGVVRGLSEEVAGLRREVDGLRRVVPLETGELGRVGGRDGTHYVRR